MNHSIEELTRRIDQIGRSRRQAARSVDVSRMAIRRALSREAQGGGPRPRTASRVLFTLLLGVALLLLAWAALHPLWTAVPPPTRVQAIADAAVPVRGASAPSPLMLHIRARRACRVRVVSDGESLGWRSVGAGDELFANPRSEVLVETDDGGALQATINGSSFALGADGHPAAVRFTPDNPLPERVKLGSAPE